MNVVSNDIWMCTCMDMFKTRSSTGLSERKAMVKNSKTKEAKCKEVLAPCTNSEAEGLSGLCGLILDN